MKLLIISSAFPPMASPEADHALHLCEHLAERGLEVHVLTTEKEVAASALPVRVHPVMRHWGWSELPRLAMFMRRCAPDAILLNYIGWIYQHHPMITFAPTVSKVVLPRVPFVTQITNVMGAATNQDARLGRALRRGMTLLAGGKNTDHAFGTLLRDSDRLIVLSDHHRVTLTDYLPAVDGKSVLIPPPPILRMSRGDGTARQRGRDRLAVKPGQFLLAYFGYIYPGKGVDTLLRAFRLVRERRSDVRLAIIGGFHDQPTHDLAVQLGIDDKVVWTGEYDWDSDEASVYLRAADACVFPFDVGVRLNNSSFAAAAAHGLPIITTRSEMLEEPFVHQGNIFLCPPKDPDAMADAIETLIERPDLRERLRAGALQLADEWFSWEKATERMLTTFNGA